ncbi:MAG: twin-arginine translocase TatA/TatE family subunit [Magnetococcus sp. DMHC-8]
MLDMGWAELLVIAIVALLAVGPEKLPEVAQGLARLIRQMQRVVREVREMINLEEFDAQIRRNSRVPDDPPGMDRDLRAETVVENEAIELEQPEQPEPTAPADLADPVAVPPVTSVPVPAESSHGPVAPARASHDHNP